MILAQLAPLFTVNDIGTRRLVIVGRNQNLFDDILNLFNCRQDSLGKTVAQNLCHLVGQQRGLFTVKFAGCFAGAADCRHDSLRIENDLCPVTLDDPGKIVFLFIGDHFQFRGVFRH